MIHRCRDYLTMMEQKNHLNRNDFLTPTNSSFELDLIKEANETTLNIFPNSLFSKKARLVYNNNFVGFMMEMTKGKVIVFGDYEQRYSIPKIGS